MHDAAVLAPCASRKFIRPNSAATAIALPNASQTAVETAWTEVVSGLIAQTAASELYGGRAFGLAKEAAACASAELYVISAGLGLVHNRRAIPSYGVTVSDRGDQAIARRIVGRFDPAAWWAAVSRSPYSERLEEVIGRHRGLVLVALTTPYAAMIGSALAAQPAEALARIRLFGHGLRAVLPERLGRNVMPYDARLDDAVPGTRTDFAQRALRHFCQHVAIDGSLGADESILEVRRLLSSHVAPSIHKRTRLSDEEMVAVISGHLERTTGVGRVLRLVRDSDELACEQARFSRLYGLANAGRMKV